MEVNNKALYIAVYMYFSVYKLRADFNTKYTRLVAFFASLKLTIPNFGQF